MINPFRLLSFLFSIGVVVFIGVKVLGVVGDTKNTINQVNAKGGEESSLFRASNLEKTFDKLRDEIGEDGQLLQLTIFPGYLIAEASTGKEESGQSYRIDADGDVQKTGLNLVGPGKLKDNIVPLAKLDPKVVESIANEAVKKQGKTLDDLSHIIAMQQPTQNGYGWNIYFDSSSTYLRANLDGSKLRNPVAAATGSTG